MTAVSLANLVAYTLQAAVVAAAALALPVVLRLDAAPFRYLYWRGALAICLALPWLQVAQPASLLGSVASLTTVALVAPAMAVPLPASARIIDWPGIILALLLAGITLRALWIAIGFARLQRLRQRATSERTMEYAELARVIGVGADIRYVHAFNHPVTFGVWRPLVLLPEALKQQPLEIREAVVAHELIHVQRRDWLWVLAEESIRAVLWFHPGIWLLISRVQAAREEVVDATVIARTGRRRAYVEALMTFADTVPLAPVTAFARRRHLFQRILLLTKENVMSARRLIGSTVVMVVVLAATVWGVAKTFPMHDRGAVSVQEVRTTAGPLEQSSRPVSAGNPLPKPTLQRNAEYPQEGLTIGARAAVILNLTVDPSGAVAETRLKGMKLAANDFTMTLEFKGPFEASIARAADLSMQSRTPEQSERLSALAVPAIKAFALSAIAAAETWRFEPPPNAPITFEVSFMFSPDGKTSALAPAPPPPPPPPAPAAAHGASVPGRIVPPPPPAPPPGTRADAQPLEGLRVGNGLPLPRKVRDVRPVYPQDARDARVQGVVIMEIRVDPGGRVDHARVLRSIPMLDAAAIDAVLQWEFQPTLLNGVATAVIMTVTVQFLLE